MIHCLFKSVAWLVAVFAVVILTLRTAYATLTDRPPSFEQFTFAECGDTPCWEGIILGETRLFDANRMLAQKGYYADVVAGAGGGESAIYTIREKIVFEDNIATEIYMPEITCPELHSFIHTYGLALGMIHVDSVEMYYPHYSIRLQKRERHNRDVYYVDLLSSNSDTMTQYSPTQLYRVDLHFNPSCS